MIYIQYIIYIIAFFLMFYTLLFSVFFIISRLDEANLCAKVRFGLFSFGSIEQMTYSLSSCSVRT